MATRSGGLKRVRTVTGAGEPPRRRIALMRTKHPHEVVIGLYGRDANCLGRMHYGKPGALYDLIDMLGGNEAARPVGFRLVADGDFTWFCLGDEGVPLDAAGLQLLTNHLSDASEYLAGESK